MVAASPIRHEPPSSLAPVAVHQYQLLSWPTFLPGAAAVGDPSTAALPSGCAQYGPSIHQHGAPPQHQQLQQLQDSIELQQPPPFQRLLNSFGNLSSLSNDEDDDDDDGVVSLPEETGPSGPRGTLVGGGGQLVVPGGGGAVILGEGRPNATMMGNGGVSGIDMQHMYVSGSQMTSTSAAAAAAAAILSAASSSFGTVTAQHAVRC